MTYTTAMAPKSHPQPFSVRMSRSTLERLEFDARRRGEPKTRTAARLIDEGLRMVDHPGIVFRDGPTGRRAALAAGPDVWEVVTVVKGTGLSGEEAIRATEEWGHLTSGEVRCAIRYYGEFQEEIDDRIRANRASAERARAAWERARAALA